jgi:hypothetical protein
MQCSRYLCSCDVRSPIPRMTPMKHTESFPLQEKTPAFIDLVANEILCIHLNWTLLLMPWLLLHLLVLLAPRPRLSQRHGTTAFIWTRPVYVIRRQVFLRTIEVNGYLGYHSMAGFHTRKQAEVWSVSTERRGRSSSVPLITIRPTLQGRAARPVILLSLGEVSAVRIAAWLRAGRPRNRVHFPGYDREPCSSLQRPDRL